MPNTKEASKARVLLSKENKATSVVEPAGETSFRVYYGATGAAVPFMWESQPGTPKHPLFSKSHDGNDDIVPPLTPPPSYTSSSSLGSNTTSKKTRKQRFLNTIFSSISRKNAHVTPTFSSLSSSTSWSTSCSSSSSFSSLHPNQKKHKKSHRRTMSLGSTRARSPLFGDHEEDNDVRSPTSSAMCFGFKSNMQGCYFIRDMKDAIFTTTNSVKSHLIV